MAEAVVPGSSFEPLIAETKDRRGGVQDRPFAYVRPAAHSFDSCERLRPLIGRIR